MGSSLPFVVRVAAGLVADTVDAVRRLPAELPTLPVTVAGTAAKLSIKVTQQLTELAGRGDELLAGLKSEDPLPEKAAWATIDDEDLPADAPAAEDPAPGVPDIGPLTPRELRDLLPSLEAGQVQAMLDAETAGANRAAVVTLLGNRLTSLDAEAGGR